MTKRKKGLTTAERRRRKPPRGKCPVKCPCICHDTGGSGHGHEGRPCDPARDGEPYLNPHYDLLGEQQNR